MGCEKCQFTAIVDEKIVHVQLRHRHLIGLSTSHELLTELLFCPYCDAFWEMPGYAKRAYERDLNHVIKYYYPEAKTLEDIVGDIKANFQPEPEPEPE